MSGRLRKVRDAALLDGDDSTRVQAWLSQRRSRYTAKIKRLGGSHVCVCGEFLAELVEATG